MIGQTISHYKITRQLGSGAMGVVYEADDLKLQRKVALKFLANESTVDQQAKARFIQEARAASALDHSNICTIYEIDETPDGRLYIAMACYHGETLEERLTRGPIEFREAAEIVLQAAAGLSRAHERGIVHRDTKPANIFLTEDGQVKILDFGIAKLVGKPGLTLADSIIGTIYYLAPEQARGDIVDGRADIWSLGAVFYQMITGCLPFPGDSPPAILYSIVNGEIEPATSRVPDLPPAIDVILDKCLDKSPASRYQTMDHLRRDLQGLLAGLQFGAEEATSAGPTRQHGTAKRRPFFLAGISVALIVLLFGVKLLFNGLQSSSDGRLQRIAVLPFENLGASTDGSFCEGMTDVVTARLAGIVGLGVISRQSATRYRGSGKSSGTIGRELDVEYLLEGTVQRENPSESPGRLRITPQLIRVDDESHIWAKSYDFGAESPFLVQTAIAERVSFELGISLMTPASQGPVDPAWSKEMYLEQARLSLETALRLASQYPENPAIVRSHFDMAVRSLIAIGILNRDHQDGEDLARAFAAIHPELSTTQSSQEIYRKYLDTYLAVAEFIPATNKYDLENELGLILAEFGVDTTLTPLPQTLMTKVEEGVDMYTGKWRKFTESVFARSGEYLPMIRQELRRRNLPEVLAMVPFLESGFNPDLESPAGGMGLWQLMPETARDYGLRVEPGGIDQRLDPFLATVAAVDFLDFLLDVFGANQFMSAVTAYNSGLGGLSSCLMNRGDWRSPWRFWDLVERDAACLSQESKDYLPLFLATAVIMQRPEAFGLTVDGNSK